MFVTLSLIFLAVTPRGGEQLSHLDSLDATQFERALHQAERRGHAERLAAPTMTMAVGERGTFLTGARIPYTMRGPDGETQVRETASELRLLLTPMAAEDALFLDLDLRWSRPDFAQAIDGAPAVQLVETSSHVPLGETWTLVKAPAPPPYPTLLRGPSRAHVEALWLLVRGALTPVP